MELATQVQIMNKAVYSSLSCWFPWERYEFAKPLKVTDEPITKIISNQLDIKLRQFMQEELDVVLTKIKNRKAAGLDEIPPEVWKTNLTTYCSNTATLYIIRTQ